MHFETIFGMTQTECLRKAQENFNTIRAKISPPRKRDDKWIINITVLDDDSAFMREIMNEIK